MTRVVDTAIGSKLAHYKFDSGALVTDSSGNSRTLTNENSVGQTTGKYEEAADFGSSNTNKRFSRNEDIWNNGALSFAAWIKRANTSDPHGFFSAVDTGVDKQLGMVANATQLQGRIFRVGVGYDTISANVNWDTLWHHIALTLTTGAGGTLKIYLDGEEVGTGSVTNASGSVNQGELYQIGYWDGSWMEGLMDDVLFTNDVLTPAEIAELASDPTSNAFLNLI